MGDAQQDSGSSGDAASCDPMAPFGSPVAITELNTPVHGDGTFRITTDELGGYFWSLRDIGSAYSKIYYASRASLSSPWTVQPTTGLDDGRASVDPSLASDGSVLVFRKSTPDDLYVAMAIDATTFAAPTALGILNSPSAETEPFLQPGGTELVFNSVRSGGGDLYRSTRMDNTFSTPSLIAEIATGFDEGDPVLSADGLALYFRRNMGGVDYDIFVARRTSPTAPFGAAQLVDNVNAIGSAEGPSSLSADGCRLYLTSDRDSTNDYDIYVATRGQ